MRMCTNIEDTNNPGNICFEDEAAKDYLNIVISSKLSTVDDLIFQGRLCFCATDKCNAGNTFESYFSSQIYVISYLLVLIAVSTDLTW